MIQAAGVADADFAVGRDNVVSCAPFLCGAGAWSGFRAVGVGRFGCAAPKRAVWALGVVVVSEFVELFLQLGNCFGWWLGCDPPFECSVESFDLALGLRVSRAAVFLLDAVVCQDFFEGVSPAFAAGQAGCEYKAIGPEP